MTAAPPSLTGEHIGRVSGSAIVRAESTSSMVIGSVKCAHGLLDPLKRLFSTTRRSSRPWRWCGQRPGSGP